VYTLCKCDIHVHACTYVYTKLVILCLRNPSSRREVPSEEKEQHSPLRKSPQLSPQKSTPPKSATPKRLTL
jgi:hypothetical protein